MTCSPHDLDAYLDGDLGPDQAALVREHAASCTACDAEINAARQLDSAFARARSVRVPSAVVAAALADARRSPARPPQAAERAAAPSPKHRFRAPVLALVAVVALATTWAIVEAPRPEAPAVAQNTPAPATDPQAIPTPESDVVLDPAMPEPASAPPDTAPPPTPTDRPSDIDRVTEDPDPEPLLAEAPASEEPLDPTPAEIEQAKDDLQLAFALIDDAQRQAARTIREESGPLTDALDHTYPFSP